MAYDIVTFGAAVQDVFLQGKLFTPKREDDGDLVEEFELGSKNEIDNVTFSIGGGATNAAVTFARQGMKCAYFGYVGNDMAGEAVKHDLNQNEVDNTLVHYSDKLSTGYSALLLAPGGERTILTYRGASSHFEIMDGELDTLNTRWFYLSSLEGNFEVIEKIILHAKSKSISVAWNPGKKELSDIEKLKPLLHGCSVLSLNKEEMALIFEGDTKEKLAEKSAEVVKVSVVTDGPNGLAACDGSKVYSAGMYEDVPVVDRTGAGDAFCSGFVSAIARGLDINKAITLGSANSTSVVGLIGAKDGILRENAPLHDMDISVNVLGKGESNV